MSWSCGFDSKWNRDIGYGVSAVCDFPGFAAAMTSGVVAVWRGDLDGIPGPEPTQATDWTAHGPGQVMGMLASALRVAAARRDRLGRRGESQWRPTPRTPMLRVVLSSADRLLPDPVYGGDACRLIQQVRMVGKAAGVRVDLAAPADR